MAVQIRCPYCKQILYIGEQEFDIETRCSHCNRAFIWSNVLEQERWKKENLKHWQESQMQQEQMLALEETKKSQEIPESSEGETAGAVIPSRLRLRLFGILILVVAAAIVVSVIALVFYLREKPETKKKTEEIKKQVATEAQKEEHRLASPDLSVSAEDLYRDYKDNEIRADARYKGKVIQIIGQVTDIGRDILGDAYIRLAGIDAGSGVQCFFPKSEEVKLEQLSRGDRVRVVGECKGMLLWNVIIFNCRRW